MRNKSLLLTLLFIFTNSVFSLTSSQTLIDELKESPSNHYVMSTWHRWFLFYENQTFPESTQLNILTQNIHVSSSLGESSGLANYQERLKLLPRSWRNAHFIQNASIKRIDGYKDRFKLSGNIHYQSERNINDTLQRGLGKLHYAVELDFSHKDKLISDLHFPLFDKVNITVNEQLPLERFEDAYLENRMRSLVHYWLALVEDNETNDPTPMAMNLFASNFSLQFPSQNRPITTEQELKAWYANARKVVKWSKHDILALQITPVQGSETEYDLSIQFDFKAYTNDSKIISALSEHKWRVEDNQNRNFPTIRSMDVKMLRPFTELNYK